MEGLKDFVQYCKDYIYEHIDEHEGRDTYLGDFGYELTEGPNMDGTLTYSTELAKEYLREWWEDAADYFKYEACNFGRNTNPFENPEAYMVCMVIEGVNALISDAVSDLGWDDMWGEKIKLTERRIDDIVEAVRGRDYISLF